MSTYSPGARDSSSTFHQRLTAADVMTVAEVADPLRVPASTVADWGRRGIMPSVKIGRRRLYIRPRIEAKLLGDAGPSRAQ
jgi:excisionase family DNA binding protein